MHRSKQDLPTWFHAAYLVSTLTPGISAVQFQRQVGLSRYETAFDMLHKLRSSLVAPDRDPRSTKAASAVKKTAAMAEEHGRRRSLPVPLSLCAGLTRKQAKTESGLVGFACA